MEGHCARERMSGAMSVVSFGVLTLAFLLVLLPPRPFAGERGAKEPSRMNQQQASGFARLALKGIQKEYPNKPGLKSDDCVRLLSRVRCCDGWSRLVSGSAMGRR